MSRVRVVGPVAWANLRSHRIQAGLIALTLAASAALLTFGLAAQGASGNAFDGLWHRTNGADLWIYVDASRATPEAIETALAGTAGIRSWGQPQRTVGVTPVGVVLTGWSEFLALRDWPADVHGLAHPLLVAGRAPRPGEPGVIVLDVNVARAWHRHLGGTVGIPTPAGVRGLRVVGLDATAENCPFPTCSPGTLYVAAGQLGALGLTRGASPGQWAVPVRVRDATPARVKAAQDALTARLPTGSLGYAARTSVTRQFASLGYATQAGLLLAFALIAAVASILLIMVAIGGAVRSDSRRIGLLKAVGFSTRQLRFTTLAEYGGLALAGGIVGAGIAAFAVPSVLGSIAQQYSASSPAAPWGWAAVAVAGVVGLTAAVALAASRRSVRIEAASALRADPSGAHRAAPLLALPLTWSRAIAELRANRARSLLSGAALALGAGALVMSAIMLGGADRSVERPAFDGARPGNFLVQSSDQLASSRAESILHAIPGVTGAVEERYTDFTLPSSTDTHVLRLRSGDLAAIPQDLTSGRELERPGEIVVGYGLARSHGLHVGGELSIVAGGVPRTFHIVGINREINNLGQMATTLASSVPGAHPFDQPQYLVALRPGTDHAAFAARVRADSGGLMNATVFSAHLLPAILSSVNSVIGSLAVVLALLTALGVFNSVLLGVQERRREFGLVRAVGMSQRQVLGTALAGTGLLALAACIVAVPLAAVGGSALFSGIQSRIGIGPLNTGIPAAAWAIGPLVVLLALVGAFGPAWSASRTSVTAVLREL